MDNFNVGPGQGPAAAMGGIGTILNLIGNLKAAGASSRAGSAQRAAADFEAAQIRQLAGQTVASSQRDSATERLKQELLTSRAIAVAGASGGAVTDPTVQKILTDITGRGTYNHAVALYQGEEKARQMNLAADAKTYEGVIAEQGGEQRAAAYRIGALGGLATGGASLYGKYGLGGPKKAPAGTSGGWWDAGTPDMSVG